MARGRPPKNKEENSVKTKKEKINYKRILLTTILFTVSAIFVVFLINISLLYFV